MCEAMTCEPIPAVDCVGISKVHYRAVMALQEECGITVIVCDPAAAKVAEAGGPEVYAKSQGAKRRKK